MTAADRDASGRLWFGSAGNGAGVYDPDLHRWQVIGSPKKVDQIVCTSEATWLLWKVGLYGLINLLVIAMILVFDPMGIAFGRMATEGSTPELEGTVATVMNRSAIVIWATYGTIALVAFIATTKVL